LVFLPDVTLDIVVRKLGHAAVFWILALLLWRAIATTTRVRRPGAWAVLLAILYAITDELHQVRRRAPRLARGRRHRRGGRRDRGLDRGWRGAPPSAAMAHSASPWTVGLVDCARSPIGARSAVVPSDPFVDAG
jgi:hypothetical protein